MSNPVSMIQTRPERSSLPCAHRGNEATKITDYTRKTGSGLARRRKQASFLRAYRKHWTVGAACKEIGVVSRSVYNWYSEDPIFAVHFDQAKDELVARLENEAIHRATVGDEHPVVNMGRIVTYDTKKSDKLLELLLKAKKPEEYDRRGGMGIEVSKDSEGQPRIKAYIGVDLDQV